MTFLTPEELQKLLEDRQKRRQFKQGYRNVGDRSIYFRSGWEANYGRYLEFLRCQGEIKDWLHEPKIFWFNAIKRGTRSYLPDFQVFRNDGTHYWVEVKGYMDAKSHTKIKRMRKYYPNEELQLIQKDWFQANKNLKALLPGWE